MKETLNGKYLAILAAVAVTILFIGARLRPREAAPAPPSPSEMAMLQQRVRREQAAGIGQYLASRAAELANQVVFLPSRGRSGVRYETSTNVLTVAGPDDLVEPLLTLANAPSEIAPAPIAVAQWNPDGWVLIIGRSKSDQLLWASGIQGASHATVCNGVTFQELVLNDALDASFAGAGAFDLDGGLLGVVMPCGNELHIVSIASIPDLLAASNRPDQEFIKKFGFRATPLSDRWQDLFPRLKGFVITDVWIGGWADRNGLLPGDLVISEAETLDAKNMEAELRVARPGRPGSVRVKFDELETTMGISLHGTSSTLPELIIARGTPAERAGLQTGDRLVSILGQRSTSLQVLSKLLAEPNQKPVWLVYQRRMKRSVVEVPHE